MRMAESPFDAKPYQLDDYFNITQLFSTEAKKSSVIEKREIA